MINFFFNEIFKKPILNFVVFLYNNLGDFGLAIIILTIVIRILIYPLSQKALASQKAINELRPKIKEIDEKYKDNKEEKTRRTLALYREHSINPFAGFVPILIQIPVFLALFSVLNTVFDPNNLNNLYSFISRPEVLNPIFFGLLDLSKPSWLLALGLSISQFFQSKMLLDQQKKQINKQDQKNDFAVMMSKQMTYIFPVMLFFIGSKFAGGLSLYWVVSNLFSIIQQRFLLK